MLCTDRFNHLRCWKGSELNQNPATVTRLLRENNLSLTITLTFLKKHPSFLWLHSVLFDGFIKRFACVRWRVSYLDRHVNVNCVASQGAAFWGKLRAACLEVWRPRSAGSCDFYNSKFVNNVTWQPQPPYARTRTPSRSRAHDSAGKIRWASCNQTTGHHGRKKKQFMFYFIYEKLDSLYLE